MAMASELKTVAVSQLDEALDLVRKGEATLYVPTYTRCTIIDKKCVARFDKAGARILWADKDGKGIRMAAGRSSVYLFAGQLKIA